MSIGSDQTVEQQRQRLMTVLQTMKAELETKLKLINGWIHEVERRF